MDHTMKLSQYLYRRPNGHYYFRIRTPHALKSIINTVEIKRSLKTKNLTVANKRALPFLSFIVRISAMSDIDDILRQLKQSGFKTTKLEVFDLAIGDMTMGKMSVDPAKEGDVEAAIKFIEAAREHQPSHSQEITSKTVQTSLQSVMDEYVQERVTSKSWTAKTKDDYLQSYDLLLRIIGCDINASQLGYDISRKVKKTLLLLPPNVNKIKKYKNKSFDQIIAMGEEPLSISTVNKLLARYSALLGWARRQGCYDIKENYFERLTINDPRDEKELRDPFSLEQLERLFIAMNNSQQTHSYYFWLPRIALYTGMRLNEICQLHLSDIKEVDGIFVFDINDDEEKTLKTKSSKRCTPIHSQLLKLGLLEVVDELKRKGKKRLFEELKYNKKYQNYADLPSKWFGRIRKKLGWVNLTPMLDFHSFRHTVITNLQEKEIPEYRVAAIVGQKVGEGVTYQRYGKGFAGQTLKADIEMLEFNFNGI